MQWEEHELHPDIELLCESVNTPGTEVAPGSHVVREHLKENGFRHHVVSICLVEPLILSGCRDRYDFKEDR